MSRTWICGIDFSEGSDRVLATAAEELSNAGGGKLVVVHVLTSPMPPSYGFAVPTSAASIYERLHIEATAHAEGVLEDRVAPLREEHPDLDIIGVVRTGDSADEILGACAAMEANRIIVGSLGKTGFQRLLLGSVAERVLRFSEVPVLVVK